MQRYKLAPNIMKILQNISIIFSFAILCSCNDTSKNKAETVQNNSIGDTINISNQTNNITTFTENEEDIEKFKAVIETAEFLKFKSSTGKFYFKLMLEGNHFATSRKYTTSLRLQKGIDEIVRYGSNSEVLDFSGNDFIFSD